MPAPVVEHRAQVPGACRGSVRWSAPATAAAALPTCRWSASALCRGGACSATSLCADSERSGECERDSERDRCTDHSLSRYHNQVSYRQLIALSVEDELDFFLARQHNRSEKTDGGDVERRIEGDLDGVARFDPIRA